METFSGKIVSTEKISNFFEGMSFKSLDMAWVFMNGACSAPGGWRLRRVVVGMDRSLPNACIRDAHPKMKGGEANKLRKFASTLLCVDGFIRH